MAHEEWCGKPCWKCAAPCQLDEEIPCSPDCHNLNADGTRNTRECEEEGCDAYEHDA